MSTLMNWRVTAACQRHAHQACWDLDIDGETPAQQGRRYTQAVAICRACPALQACRDWATTRVETHGDITGIWAGELIGDGVRLVGCARSGCAAVFRLRASQHRKYCCRECRLVASRLAARTQTPTPPAAAPKRAPAQSAATPRPPAPAHCGLDGCAEPISPERRRRRAKYCREEHGIRAGHLRWHAARTASGRDRKPAPVQPGVTHCSRPGCILRLTKAQIKHGVPHCTPRCRDLDADFRALHHAAPGTTQTGAAA